MRLLVGGKKEEWHRRLGLTLPFFCSARTRRTTTDQNTREEGRKKAKRYSEERRNERTSESLETTRKRWSDSEREGGLRCHEAGMKRASDDAVDGLRPPSLHSRPLPLCIRDSESGALTPDSVGSQHRGDRVDSLPYIVWKIEATEE